MSTPTYAMAGEELIGLLGAAGVRAWLGRRPMADTADLVAALARRHHIPGPREPRHRLWTWPVRCDRPHEPATPTAIDHEASAALREAVWIARAKAGRPADEAAPRWCGCAHRVVRRALRVAADLRVRDAHGGHLVQAIAGDPTCCGYRALTEAGLNPREIRPAGLDQDGHVHAPALRQLMKLGALAHPRPNPLRRATGPLALRRAGASAMAYAIGTEAARQAVRTGVDQIGAVHVLSGICAVGFQHRRTTWVFEGGHDQASELLARLGLAYPEMEAVVARTETDPGSGDHYGPWRLVPSDPGFAPTGRAVFRLAQSYVDYLGHRAVAGDHLLMGCIEVDSPAVRAAVTKAGADYEELRRQAARLLIASP